MWRFPAVSVARKIGGKDGHKDEWGARKKLPKTYTYVYSARADNLAEMNADV